MNFLETEDVVKQYANHLALDKVSIQVPEGSKELGERIILKM